MGDVRKLPASAGAEWLLGGLALLRKAPLGLGLLGLIYGAISLLAGLAVQRDMSLFMVLELALVLFGPILIGGMIHAAREVDHDRPAAPGQLLQGIHDHKVGRLLATLLPQIAAFLVAVVLLVLMIGPAALADLATAMEKVQAQGGQPDPGLLADLPFGRMLAWLLLVIAIGVVAGFFTFVGLPEIMLTDARAWPAMRRSFRACLRNLPAMVVFFVLAIIAMFAFYFVLMLVALLVGALAGQAAVQVVVQLLMMAVLLPVVTGAMYVAWKQMLGQDAAAAVPTATGMSGFEA